MRLKQPWIVSAMTLIIKAIILLLMVFILYSLGSALYFIVHDKPKSDRAVKALSWRIGLSIALFVILMLAYAMGWITPNQL